MKNLKLKEIKKQLLNYDLYDLFDDYVDDTHITIINDDNIIIHVIIDDATNYVVLSKNDFMQLNDIRFEKLINELVYYAQ